MTELAFGATVWWTGCGRDGAGGVSTGSHELEYSAPRSTICSPGMGSRWSAAWIEQPLAPCASQRGRQR